MAVEKSKRDEGLVVGADEGEFFVDEGGECALEVSFGVEAALFAQDAF